MARKRKRKRPVLTLAEKLMVLKFTEDPLGYPREKFDNVVKRLLGPKGFPDGENRAFFIRQCRRAYRIGPNGRAL